MHDDQRDDISRDPPTDPAWLTNQIAHALRNQIFAALVHAEIVQHRVQTDPVLRREVETLFEQVKRLDATIEEMLLFGRDIALKRSPVRVHGLLDELAAEYREGRRVEPAQVSVDADPDLTAPWDLRAVRIILERLLDNAVQHSPAPHTVDLTATTDGAGVVLTVADRGEGLAAEVEGSAFQPFVPQHRGRIGLGLAVARKFARALGGDVTLTARPGGGVEARCTLPLGDE